jgi:hypothetical protein
MHLSCKKFLLLMAFALINVQFAFSMDNSNSAYIVDNIKVVLPGPASKESRIRAFSVAQRQALSSIAESTGVTVSSLSDEQIDSLVQDTEVSEEKVSVADYRATITVRFKRELQSLLDKYRSSSSTGGDVSGTVVKPVPDQDSVNSVNNVFESCRVTIVVNSLDKWKLIRDKLKSNPLIKDFIIMNMVNGEVDVSLKVVNREKTILSLCNNCQLSGVWPFLKLIVG